MVRYDGTIRWYDMKEGESRLLLTVRNVQKVFGAGEASYLAWDGINLDVSAGELVCLLGPSGCGKSTLLNILAGFEPPSSGSVTSNGIGVTGAGRDRVMF